jgi:CheY-like chemotaxis protein
MPGRPASDGRGRTILLVEDNADHALLVRMAAERADSDLDVRVVGDGLDALAYLEGTGRYASRDAHPLPHLVILDLAMPHLDGFGVLEWLRGRRELAAIPVVVLTSSANPHDERRAIRLGARAFHTKPADLDALGVQVRELVKRWTR